MKRVASCIEPYPPFERRLCLTDRFISLSMSKQRFEMHQEIADLASVKNIIPKHDASVLPRLLLEQMVPNKAILATATHKKPVENRETSASSSLPSLLCRTESRRLFSYDTQPMCKLLSEESFLNSNANILDLGGHDHMYLVDRKLVYRYEASTNRTIEAYRDALPIYSLKTNNFSDNFIGICFTNGEFVVADMHVQCPVRTYRGLAPEEKILTVDWTTSAVIHGTNKGQVMFRDVRTKGDEKLVFKAHNGRVSCVKANRFCENLVLSADTEGTIALCDRRKGVVRTFHEHQQSVRRVAWSPNDARCFLSGGKFDGLMKYWNSEQQESLETIEVGTSVYNVEFTKEGNWVATCGRPTFDVRIFDSNDLGLILSLGKHKNSVYHFALNEERSVAVSGSQDGELLFWDFRDHNNSPRADEPGKHSWAIQQPQKFDF
jgi:WD40 repeat protein